MFTVYFTNEILWVSGVDKSYEDFTTIYMWIIHVYINLAIQYFNLIQRDLLSALWYDLQIPLSLSSWAYGEVVVSNIVDAIS